MRLVSDSRVTKVSMSTESTSTYWQAMCSTKALRSHRGKANFRGDSQALISLMIWL